MACYIVGCKSGNGYSKETCHIFKCPSGADAYTKQKWIQNIPKRSDKSFDLKTSRICFKHFEEKYIVKTRKIYLGTEVMSEHPLEKWRLTPNAIPSKFTNEQVPKYFDRKVYTRKPPKFRPPLRTLATNTLECSPEQTFEPEIIPVPCKPAIDIDKLRIIQLPKLWVAMKKESSVRFCDMREDELSKIPTFYAHKSIEVFSDGRVVAFIRSKDVSSSVASVSNIEEVGRLIEDFSTRKLCEGANNLNMFSVWPSAHKCMKIWYSDICEITLSENFVCQHCLALQNKMKKQAESCIRRKSTPIPTKVSQKLSRLAKQKKVADLRISRLVLRNKELKQMHAKFLKTSNKDLELAIREANLPEAMKASMIQSAQFAKAKSKHARRYQPDWLLQSLLLKITNPRGYRFLRNNNILPLPNPRYLTSLLKGLPCQFGFNSFVFDELKKQYANKPKRQKKFMVLVDEVSVKEKIAFDKSRMQFQGFIDFAEFSSEAKPSTSSKREADHCLVFMARCIDSQVAQPLGAFATRGAAPGHMLAKMTLSCIMKLEESGCEVVGVVWDGATTNKAAWRALGISGKHGNVTNRIPNPFDERRSVFFFCDIPHILKCIRNHLHKHEDVKFGDSVVSWRYFRALYDVDKSEHVRAAPKLTQQHINPGPFQKMVVSHAAQIFSKTVADALRFYRECIGNTLFRSSQPTEEFARKINDLFDACNARIPKFGIKPGSKGFIVISDFLASISPSDSYASTETFESLRVTLSSILDATTFLCEEEGYLYVLSGHFNQDKLEKFFGLCRSFGGDNSHPTVTTFAHIFRLLSIYSPTAKTIRGNIRTDEDCPIAIVAYVDTLKRMRASVTEDNKKNRMYLEEIILNKIISEEYLPADTEVVDKNLISVEHNYIRPDADSCKIYQLCGFLAFKARSFTKCESCVSSLIESSPTNPSRCLTVIKDLGGLKHPSDALFTLVKDVLEPNLSEKLKSSVISTDFVSNFLESLPTVNHQGIGCSEDHGVSLMEQIRFGVDISPLLPTEFLRCFTIPLNPNPSKLFKRGNRRQRAWASETSSERHMTDMRNAKLALNAKAEKRTVRRLLKLINEVQLNEVIVDSRKALSERMAANCHNEQPGIKRKRQKCVKYVYGAGKFNV